MSTGAVDPRPAVTVVVAAHDAAFTVGSAIASVREQTVSNIEILVVDDASTDDTASVVAGVVRDDSRVRLIRLERNSGPGAARNAAIAEARGKWIAVLDADDSFAPYRLQGLLDLARRTRADVVADNLAMSSAAGGAVSTLLPEDGGPFRVGATDFVRSNRGRRGQGRVLLGFLKPMVRAAFLREHALTYPSLRLAEDYGFLLACLAAGAELQVSPDPTYRYTVREGSLTATYGPSDLFAVAALDARLSRQPEVVADPVLHAEIRRHGLAAHDAAVWTLLVSALRARSGSAVRTTLSLPRAGRVAALRGPQAACRALGRRFI